MNLNASSLARDTFLQAVQPGPVREAAAVLAKLQAEGDGVLLNVGELENALDTEFPWRNQLVFQSRQPESDELDAWTQAIRWLMQSLLETDMSAKGSVRRLQVLLTALGALDVGHEGLNAVSDCFSGTRVPTGIISMLQRVEQIPEGLDARSKACLQELSDQVKNGNFKLLEQAQQVIQPLFRSDSRTALFLLWKLEPAELAHLINTQDSILLAKVVCMVLDADAPLFALQVENVTFKFISLSWLERLKSTSPEVNILGVLEQLLLQVAKTPYWKGWLHARYEHPVAGSQDSRALAEALTKLAEAQWRDFIFALALSELPGSAQAVADILTHVACKLNSVRAQSIWSDAFERWNAWDYGRGEGHFFLSTPQVCVFDFPVAMYYAHMSSAERDTLERDLQNAIVHIEQQWFTSESELCTERNRLASRLRLIRHGSALAAGEEIAPPPPVQPDSEYAKVRYRYHDVNATLVRTINL
jgi:hypothetical protein